MKKVLAICLTMIILVSVSATVFAAPGRFVSSPSGNPAPEVVSFVPNNGDCTATAVVTPYGDRNNLPDSLCQVLEKAYGEIVNSDNLTELNGELAKIATDKKIDGTKLAVSDLFDIHVTGCDYHDEHVDFDVILDADTLNHFVGLLHMNKDSEWEFVADAEVVNNGEHLKFSVDSFSPFAIVVDTTAGGDDVPTGGNVIPYLWVILLVVLALILVLVIILAKNKKKKA